MCGHEADRGKGVQLDPCGGICRSMLGCLRVSKSSRVHLLVTNNNWLAHVDTSILQQHYVVWFPLFQTYETSQVFTVICCIALLFVNAMHWHQIPVGGSG